MTFSILLVSKFGPIQTMAEFPSDAK